MSLEFDIVKPPSFGWLQASLKKEHVDYLWKIIKNHPGKSHKEHLIGNVSDSYALIDENNYFQNEVVRPLSSAYYQMSGNKHPMQNYVRTLNQYTLDLDSLWFNRQKKHEFNPMHDHGGVYSFVIWLKIPYDWREEQSLPQFNGTKNEDKKAGQFEFEYYDIFGRKSHYNLNLDSTWENKMVFFPSMFNHCAYPFYTSDEDRISVSGNLWLNPVKYNDPKSDEDNYKRDENKRPEDNIESLPIEPLTVSENGKIDPNSIKEQFAEQFEKKKYFEVPKPDIPFDNPWNKLKPDSASKESDWWAN